MMRLGTVCSGIGGGELAFAGLAEHAFAAEVAPFPRAVLAHRFPEVPLRGDFTDIQAGDHPAIDVLAAGTPCQSFSVAGLRGGLADQRGNLALEYLRLADRLRPRWLLWENVPGVLSSAGGRDFGAFLGGMVELGYGFAYRVLDAQHFGLAQRRQRVFVVGCLGDWRRAAAVLFEPASLRGHPAPGREAGAGVAATLKASAGRRCGQPSDGDVGGQLIAGTLEATIGRSRGAGTPVAALTFGGGANCAETDVATSVSAHPGGSRLDFLTKTFVTHTLRGTGFDASEDGIGRGTPLVPVFQCHGSNVGQIGTLKATGNVTGGVPFLPVGVMGEVSHALPTCSGGGAVSEDGSGRGIPVVNAASAVRRLTPRECERLQGYPDDWTLIPWRKGEAPDGPRYAAIGNA